MFRKNNIIILIILLTLPKILLSSLITAVYNLKIGETTQRHPFEEKVSWSLTVTPFSQNRKTLNKIYQNANGSLGSIAYIAHSFYARLDFAAAHVSEKFRGLKNARTQPDDILFYLGYSKAIKHKLKLTASGLLGLPTHKDIILQGIEFGTGHFGLGFQFDSAFSYTEDKNHRLLTAARFVHFFPRQTFSKDMEGRKKYIYSPGEAIDILAANYNIFGKHTLEYGYEFSFIINGHITPLLTSFQKSANYIISGPYAVYAYNFLINKIQNAIAIAFSYSFGITPKDVGYQRITTAWLYWDLDF